MKIKIKNVPTKQQMVNEFSLPQTTINWLERKGTDGFEKIQIYREAWLYRVIYSFLSTKRKESFTRIVPIKKELENEFGEFYRYTHNLEKNKNAIMLLHIDSWNLRYVILPKILYKDIKEVEQIKSLNSYSSCCSLKYNSKPIPSNKQIIEEFDLANSTIYAMKKNGERGISKRNLYNEAWLYQTIVSFMSDENRKNFNIIIPNAIQLVNEFGKTRQNYSEHKRNKTKMYDVYIDVWNLRHNILNKF